MTKTLAELNARWYHGGTGVVLQCPLHPEEDLSIFFKNPLRGMPREELKGTYWQRTGETLDDLTVTPTVDYPSHVSIRIENGRVTVL